MFLLVLFQIVRSHCFDERRCLPQCQADSVAGDRVDAP
jgi:hypothetical protein